MATMVNTTGTPTELIGFSTTIYDYGDYYDYDDEGHTPCAYESHENHLLRALYSLFFMFGLLANVFVVWVIVLGAQLRRMTGVCLLNLALGDLILVLSLPFLIYYFQHNWIFGRTMCTLVLGIYCVSFYSGAFFIVLMSIDRYLVLVHDVHALRVQTKTCGIGVSLVIWIIAVAASFPELLYIGIIQLNKEVICTAYLDSSDNHYFRAVGIFKMNILGLLIPLSIVGFCFLMVMCKRVQSTRKPNVRLEALVAVVFFCCWMPYNIAALFTGLQLRGVVLTDCTSNKWVQLALQFTDAVAYSHCCLNPILYVLVGEKFKWHLVRFLRWTPCFKLPFVGRCLPQVPELSSETSSMEERSTAI